MIKARLLVLSAIAVLAASAPAAPFAYVTTYTQLLMRIDLQSAATVTVGTLGFTAEGLAATSSGRLYATNPNGNLFDVTGGVVTPVAPLGALSVGSMDSAGSTLWGYDNTSQRLFEYDPISTSFLQWSTPLSIPNLKALVIDSSGDFLFIANAGSVDKYGKITNGTWAVSLINPNMGLADHCEAMDFLSDGNIYAAVLGDIRYQIDPVTGSQISGFNSGVHRDWGDMTSVPVPEPATLLLVGLGSAYLTRRRKARQEAGGT